MSDRRRHRPLGAGAPARQGAGPTPAAPTPAADAEGREGRRFEVNGEEWLAQLAGQGALGSGRLALAAIQAVHFYRSDQPERPLFEALLPRGRFGQLRDAELRELLDRSTPVPPASDVGH